MNDMITPKMIDAYLLCHRLESNESTREGAVQAIEAYIRGEGVMDARLTDSPETRDLFNPVRNAYFAVHKVDPATTAYSNVSFFDPAPQVRTTDGRPPVSGIDAERQAAEDAAAGRGEVNSSQTNE